MLPASAPPPLSSEMCDASIQCFHTHTHCVSKPTRVRISVRHTYKEDSHLSSSHLPVAAPFRLITSLQTFLNPRAMLRAARRALKELQMLRTRAWYDIFPKTGRPCCKSFKSATRNLFLRHAQKRSTGLRSGDFAGTRHNFTLCCLWAFLEILARRKDSPSQRIFQGPRWLQPIEPSNNLSDSVYTCRVLAEAAPVFVISYWQASR